MILALLSLSLAAEKSEPAITKIAKETKAYQYSFEWPAEVAAIPGLEKMLRSSAQEASAEFAANAEAEYRESVEAKDHWFPEVGYQLSRNYELSGKSDTILSLSGGWYTFTGGAHGNYGANAILWDLQQRREIEVADLFDRVTEFVLMHPAMCTALNKDRAENRGGEKMDTSFDALDDAFNGCPKYDELTIWISDEDKNGRFDTFNFSADPYVAGPYAEGSYLVELPLSDRTVAAMKPQYRDSFEVRQTQ